MRRTNWFLPMKIDFIREPELEFGVGGRHIDIRFGIMSYGPLDRAERVGPREIRVGIVGTNEGVEKLEEWLERCCKGLPGKQSKQPNLFPRFPGFSADSCFNSDLIIDARLERRLTVKEIEKLDSGKIIEEATEMYLREVKNLAENRSVDVILCAVPMELLRKTGGVADVHSGDIEEGYDKGRKEQKFDFHDMLKAKTMVSTGKPIQLVLPSTYDETKRRVQKEVMQDVREVQDEATRAWNLNTALYYKANGVPWRLVRDVSELATCYVGISFYLSLDKSKMLTSIAQLFNERGEGLILRGGPAKVSEEDKQPHLNAEDAHGLLDLGLSKYRDEHHTLPARVVLHKTSKYSCEELEGFNGALQAHEIHTADLLTVRVSFTRLFRRGAYPPLRGTYLIIDGRTQLLYTRGSVDFFRTYPGLYVPKTINIECEQIEKTPTFLAQEILALTKMNWNDTQFDGFLPITVRAAREVGKILKYVKSEQPIQHRYSFYM